MSQEASAAAIAGVASIAVDDEATLAVRQDALFYLAQGPHGEGIPALVRVAESPKSAKLRKDAIWFWRRAATSGHWSSLRSCSSADKPLIDSDMFPSRAGR